MSKRKTTRRMVNLETIAAGLDNFPGNIVIFRADDDAKILYANKCALDLFECGSMEELLEHTQGSFGGMVYSDDRKSTEELFSVREHAERGGTVRMFYRIWTAKERTVFVEHFCNLIYDENGDMLCYTFIIAQEPAYSAHFVDPLTGLYSMRHFMDMLEEKRMLDVKHKVSGTGVFIFFNIFDFKSYNSARGFEAGTMALIRVAGILRDVFQTDYITHVADDHFIVYIEAGAELEKVRKAHELAESIDEELRPQLQAGIYYSTKDVKTSVACDLAKIACDALKDEKSSFYCVYSENLREDVEVRDYIAENIDRAIAEGFIQLRYQPVIRTLTGRLCGIEVLTRWNDPQYGIIAPGFFVPVLERENLIYKLDTFVIEQVTKNIRQQINRGNTVVPVSVNLSRMDFTVCDPYEVIEKAVCEYELPRDLLCIEITEDSVMQDPERMKFEIDRFHEGGFEVSIDNFGKGYSSLKLLRDFDFDEIKIDMGSIANLDKRAQDVVVATVDMAKKLGIRTVVEGVSSREQVNFFSSIGCEKIQGYYYGKPQPYHDMQVHLRNYGIVTESRIYRDFYNEVGKVNLISGKPVALIFDNGKRFNLQFANDEYRRVASIPGYSDEHVVDMNMNSMDSPLSGKFRELADRAIKSGNQEMMTFIDRNHYFRFTFKVVARAQFGYMHLTTMTDITYDRDQKRASDLDAVLRNVITVYDRVYMLNFTENFIEVLITNQSDESVAERVYNIHLHYWEYCERHVYLEDQDRFRAFCTRDYLVNHVKMSGRGNFTEMFRIRQDDGNYQWIEFMVLTIPESNMQRMLLCMKPAMVEDQDDPYKFAEMIMGSRRTVRYSGNGSAWNTDGDLWRSLMRESDIKFFWKDMEGKYIGASHSFLKYMGVNSIEEIRGKTDREIGWCIDGNTVEEADRQVLMKGKSVRELKVSCIVDGAMRWIRCNIFPIYRRGFINGIIGYIRDLNHIMNEAKVDERMLFRDSVTGFMNPEGAIIAVAEFDKNYQSRKENYAAGIVSIRDHAGDFESFDKESVRDLQRQVSKIITKLFGRDAVVARINNFKFAIWKKNVSAGRMTDHIYDFLDEIHKIRDVRGHTCTLYVDWSVGERSEAGNVRRLFSLLEERLEDAVNQELGMAEYTGYTMLFDRSTFDNLDTGVMMMDPDTYNLVYMNHRGREMFNIRRDDSLLGKRCFEVLTGRTSPCEFCTLAQCSRTRFIGWEFHDESSGYDYSVNDTLVPWKGKRYKFTLFRRLNDERKDNMADSINYGRMLNDLLTLGMRQEKMDTGIMKMVERMGPGFRADRIVLFEKDGIDYMTAGYEWHREGIRSAKQVLQKVSLENMRSLNREFERNKIFAVRDVSKASSLIPEEQQYYREFGINSLIAIEVKSGRESFGFLEIDNPAEEVFDKIGELALTISTSLAILIRNRNMMNQLDALSARDSLTGTMNRRAFEERLKNLRDKPFAVIYGDINGLKLVNDNEGHEAGDLLIKNAANVLKDHFGQDNVFRLGGDEFVVVFEMEDRDEIDSLVDQLLKEFHRQNVSMALGCAWKERPTGDESDVLKEADRRMYVNKQYMHSIRGDAPSQHLN